MLYSRILGSDKDVVKSIRQLKASKLRNHYLCNTTEFCYFLIKNLLFYYVVIRLKVINVTFLFFNFIFVHRSLKKLLTFKVFTSFLQSRYHS
jgi:hypothetical protein